MTVTVVSAASDGGEVNEGRVGDTGGECPYGWRKRDGFFHYFERRRHLVVRVRETRGWQARGKFRDRPTNEHHANSQIYSIDYFLFDCPVSFVSFTDAFCDAPRFPIPRFFQSSRSMSPLQVHQPFVSNRASTHAHRFMRQSR